jgi:hypothetical protein
MLLLILPFFTVFLFGLSDDKDASERIIWNDDVILTWNDFKGTNFKGSVLAAETNSGIHFNYRCSGKTMDLEIFAYFDKNLSWAKPNLTEFVLKHEQLHFAITELFARKLRQKFSKMHNPCSKSKSDIQAIFTETMREHRAYQNLYDRETNHSLNKKEQGDWEVKIGEQLSKF